eukprot:2131677-Amphidinium_carterae.1
MQVLRPSLHYNNMESNPGAATHSYSRNEEMIRLHANLTLRGSVQMKANEPQNNLQGTLNSKVKLSTHFQVWPGQVDALGTICDQAARCVSHELAGIHAKQRQNQLWKRYL